MTPLSLESIQEMQELMRTVQRDFFPKLDSFIIIMEPHAPDDHFYQARFKFFGFFMPKNKRTYLIKFHVDSLHWPKNLLRAMLVHELSHISDFSQMNFTQAFSFGFRYLTNSEFLSRYERATDLQALQRAPALAPDQIELKRWMYKLVGPAKEQKYRQNYMTPESIEKWISESRA